MSNEAEEEDVILAATSIFQNMIAAYVYFYDDGRQGPRRKRRVPSYGTSIWAIMLQNRELCDDNSREAKKFRQRFRIPHELFIRLLSWTPLPAVWRNSRQKPQKIKNTKNDSHIK
jgi:hypothetical protein